MLRLPCRGAQKITITLRTMKAALFENPVYCQLSRETSPVERERSPCPCRGVRICGTDLHIVDDFPLSAAVVLGHGVSECGGPGSAVESRGSRVAIDPNIACGTCFFCRRSCASLCGLRHSELTIDRDG